MNKRIWVSVVIILIYSFPAKSQVYTLQQCQDKAKEVSPLQKQKLYNESIAQLQESSANTANLPQLLLSAHASYQSDVFGLPFSIPGSETPEIPKDQYRASLTVQQKLFDGGTTRRNREVIAAGLEANQQQLEVEIYQITQLVNQLYFGLLLQQEREKIILASKETLSLKLKELESLEDNGVILKSNLFAVQKQLLTLDQQLIEVQSGKEVLRQMLSKWIEQDIEKNATFEIPEVNKSVADLSINTPQLASFDASVKQFEASRSLQSIRNYPKVFAFATGGMGSPNPYNMFETDFADYYMVGLKLEWNIYDFGRKNNDISVLNYQSQIINSRRENYIKQTEIGLVQQSENVKKYQLMLDQDEEILKLQKEVVKEADSQLKNGVITSTQYITETNNQLQAELNAKIHELKLVESQIEYLTKTGNL